MKLENNIESGLPDLITDHPFFMASIYARRLDSGAIHIWEQSGFTPTLEEWEQIRQDIDAFYRQFSADEVRQFNAMAAARLSRNRESVPLLITIPDSIESKCNLSGWVYLITSPAKRGYKIGCTSQKLRKRLKEVARKLRADITCWAAINVEQPFEIESRLHAVYSEQCIGGEWFNLEPLHVDAWPGLVEHLRCEVLEGR